MPPAPDYDCGVQEEAAGPALTRELKRELRELVTELLTCRERLDDLQCHAAAADVNQAVERLASFMRGTGRFP